MTILHKLASSLQRRDEVHRMSAKIVNDCNKEAYNRVVEARGRGLAKESQRKRVARVLKKVMA